MSAAERKSSAGGASLLARLRRHYRFHFTEPRRERLFLASVGFGAGAVTVRTVTHMIRHNIGPSSRPVHGATTAHPEFEAAQFTGGEAANQARMPVEEVRGS